MLVPMGRRRQHDLDLPPHMHRRMRGGAPRYYYGRLHIALGADFAAALKKYAELHTAHAEPGTFADAAAEYRRLEMGKRAPATQAGYEAQLTTLVGIFGRMQLDEIRPKDVADMMEAIGKRRVDTKGQRHGGPIIATRTKALMSAVLTFARARGLMNGPNPCAGMRGAKAKRRRLVSDAELSAAMTKARPALAGFLELVYRTGQRPGDVVKMRRQDVQDGALRVQQTKTGATVSIAVEGALEALLARLSAGPVSSMYLVHDAKGQPFTLAALRKRFDRLGFDWQIRDLRAKAASDSKDAREAQALLGHAAASTTDGYIRQHAGARATPINRKIAGKPS